MPFELELNGGHLASARCRLIPVDVISQMPPVRCRRSIDQIELFSASIVFCISWLGGLFIRGPYSDLFFVLDDFDILAHIGLLETGKISWKSYLLWPVGANPMPVWKFVAFLEWKLFGLNPWWWHLFIGAVQALSASFLFLLLRHYQPSHFGAWIGSLLWGLSAIGQMDNPMILLCCGNFALAIAWLLLAMIFLPHFVADPNWKHALGLFSSVTMSLMTWGVMVALVPVLLLQFVFFERRQMKDKRSLTWWVAAWSIPCLAAFVIQLNAMLALAGNEDRQRDFDLVNMLQLTVAQFGVSFRHLFLDWIPNSSPLVIGSVALTVVGLSSLAGVFRVPLTRLLLLFFYVAATFLILTTIGGVDTTFSRALKMGHYHYIPILFWCVTAGVVVEQFVLRVGPRQMWLQGVCGIVILAAYAFGQIQIAQRTESEFKQVFTGTIADYHDTQRLLVDLSAESDRESPVIIPDFRVPVPSNDPVFFPLSAFAKVSFPQGLANVRILPCDELPDDNVAQIIERFEGSSNPVSAACLDNLRQTIKMVHLIRWLSEFTAQQDAELPIPYIGVPKASENTRSDPQFCPSQVLLFDYFRFGFSVPPSNLVLAPNAVKGSFTLSLANLRELIVSLRINPDEEARYWEEALNWTP